MPSVIEHSPGDTIMEWIEARIEFEADTTVVAEELIAEVFYAFGVKGVMVEDPDTEAPPGALMDEDVRPPTNSVSGYFPAAAFDQERRRAFEAAVARMAARRTSSRSCRIGSPINCSLLGGNGRSNRGR